VRQEIRLARQEGKMVSPVKGRGLDLGKLPRWLGQVYDLDLPARTAPIRVLQDQRPVRGEMSGFVEGGVNAVSRNDGLKMQEAQ
jgi:hypothetical protein